MGKKVHLGGKMSNDGIRLSDSLSSGLDGESEDRVRERLEALVRSLPQGYKVIVLTGAGISVESGIPTFRGKDGIWTVGSKHYYPAEMATRRAFSAMPEEVWKWYLYRLRRYGKATPNQGHLAVAKLEEILQDRFLLVTQNVDGLHLKAGNSQERTYEIHGNINFMRCFSGCTDMLFPVDPYVDSDFKGVPKCPKCGGWARPHVLWFDECYDEENFRFVSSQAAAQECSLLITVGTSGATNLPTRIVSLVVECGGTLLDINPDMNPFASAAARTGGFHIPWKAGKALPLVVEVIEKWA